jgi:acyl carrier protein
MGAPSSVAAALSEVLGVDPDEIDARKPFSHYGLGSTEAVMIVGDLENWLGRVFPETLAFDYPNIESLSQHLGGHLNDYDAPRWE